MEGELSLTPEQLANLSPEAILKLLDTGWPWPLDAVQEWFETLWDTIIEYFWRVVDWIYDRIKPVIDTVWAWLNSAVNWLWNLIKPAIDTVWDWLQSGWNWVIEHVKSIVSVVWDWLKTSADWLWQKISSGLQNVWGWLKATGDWLWAHIQPVLNSIWTTLGTIPGIVAEKVAAVNKWFSDEFIDPFIDWLVQLPGKLWESFEAIWLKAWDWIVKAFTKGTEENRLLHTILEATLVALLAAAGALFATPIITAVRWVGASLLRFAPLIGGWFTKVFSLFGGWLIALAPAFLGFLGKLLGIFSKWAMGAWLPVIASGTILALEATGQLQGLISKFITPAIVGIFAHFEAMGPVAPQSGSGMSTGITKMAEFTISGLAAMTLGGELLSPLKQLGLGNISAIIFDLINYRTLTAAFMGVLAFVYIRQPLTYYYQRAARPNIPEERALTQLAGEYVISKEEFQENMQWHGYPDEWITKLYELADRPFSPMLFKFLADAGVLDEELIERELRNASYNEKSIPYLKEAFGRLATGELKTLMTSTAMTRYKEGLDDVGSLKENLLALGVREQFMDRYLFAAQLSYLTDYQTDLLAYYKDAYHRREIEEPELRRGLASLGLNPQRIELSVARESIKRLKTAVT